MHCLVFQHLEAEHPGVFREFFAASGDTFDVIRFDLDQPIPALDRYDMMLVMGGPQDTWQEAEYPWLVREKIAIREFVETWQKPYLGICLGHQLLAAALGGTVAPSATPEVGVMPIEKTPEGEAEPALAGFADIATVLQWHGAEVTKLPASAVSLASSPACAVQAMRIRDHAFGIQFHIEATTETVADWMAVPENAIVLQRVLGDAAAGNLALEVRQNLPDFRTAAERLYHEVRAKSAAAL